MRARVPLAGRHHACAAVALLSGLLSASAAKAQGPSVSPQGSLLAEPPNQTGLTTTFGVQNNGGYQERYILTCTPAGMVASCSAPSSINVAPYGYAQVTVTISTNSGTTGTVSLRAASVHGNGSGYWNVQLAQAKVAITPDTADTSVVENATGLGYLFTVKNTGNTSGTIALSIPTCRLPATSCMPARTSILLNALASDTVRVQYATGAAGTGGRIVLRGTVGSLQDSGAVNVAAYVQPPLQNPALAGPGIERDLCLTAAAGEGAASECGALRLVHVLPAVTTRNKRRVPTLLYNSQTAHPYPVVATTVTLASTDAVPTNVQATLIVGGVTRSTQTWAGTNWSPGTTRRIAVGYDALADATGSYAYSLAVTKLVNGSLLTVRTDTGHVVIVNRSASPFGPGWWLAGLDQLLPLADGSKLFVGGDGSARIYYPVTGRSDLWSAPQVDHPDFVQTEGVYVAQHLPGGVKVLFDAAGLHRLTVNPLGDTTSFVWSSTCSQQLQSITVPHGLSPSYQFTYAPSCGALDSVKRVVDAATTTLSWDNSQTLRATDPDATSVRYTYSSVTGSERQIVTRTNQLGNNTSYSYDAAHRLSQVSISMGTAPALVTTFANVETKGLGGSAAIDTALAYTRIDGPRTDVADSTQFWLDRLGAPRKIRDALGGITQIDRTDPRWPALVTKVRDANGRVQTSTYDIHGNVASITDSSTSNIVLGTRVFATAQYQWNLEWDKPTQITMPEGDVAQMAYDLVTGNLLWRQDGRGASSRTSFQYYPDNVAEARFLRVLQWPDGASRTFAYDSVGNLASSSNELNYLTFVDRDALGRVARVRTQIDASGNWQRDSTVYDLADEPTLQISSGPPLNGATAESVYVRTYYDAAGRDTAIARWSAPDLDTIGTALTRYHRDPAGRVLAEVAPDGAIDSATYDPAGNPTVRFSRRHRSTGAPYQTQLTYDVLNRLTRRITDSVHYAPVTLGIAAARLGDATRNKPYPRYPTDADGGYTVRTDTASFTYDAVGHILTAWNGDARITRAYYQSGRDSTDTQVIRTYAHQADGSDWTKHVYTIKYFYDLDGRLTVTHHPTQLAPSATGRGTDSTVYVYDKPSGNLYSAYDPLSAQFAFTFDGRSRLTRIDLPGSIWEAFTYNVDGSLATDIIHNQSVSPTRWADATLRSATFSYDARGKMLSARNVYGVRDTLRYLYSGLGHLVTTRDSSFDQIDPLTQAHFTSDETFKLDALGNIAQSTLTTTQIQSDERWIANQTSIQNTYWHNGTGRLATSHPSANSRRDTTWYDGAGNAEFTYALAGGASEQDRYSYFGIDGKLRAIDSRLAKVNGGSNGQGGTVQPGQDFTFEEYRYDALGRRVLVRSRRWCDGSEPLVSRRACLISFIRRTVWDGNNELYEIQMPGGDALTTAPPQTDAVLENDTGTITEQPEDSAQQWLDPNPFYGRVAYLHGLGIDRPLSVTRISYAERASQSDTYYRFPVFSVAPHWNALGNPDDGTFADGGAIFCDGTGSAQRCERLIVWPYGWSSYRQRLHPPQTWLGSLVDQKAEATGLLFRRNRYVDPMTGRFTQEDPIGLAGGMNLYGFAGSDPVSYSDPFGLCPPQDDNPYDCPGNMGAFVLLGQRAPAINKAVALFLPTTASFAVGGAGETGAGITSLRLAGRGGQIIREAAAILRSSGMAELRAAAAAGREATVEIGGRTITYTPQNFSAFTNFAGKGFDLGKEAFSSTAELTKSVLHELYRLNTSVVSSGGALGGAQATLETNAAYNFAEQAFGLGRAFGIW